jgi:hypothetical protein
MNETIHVNLDAPVKSFTYDVELDMFTVDHGNWSEWVGYDEWLRRVEAGRLYWARMRLLDTIREEVRLGEQAYEVD